MCCTKDILWSLNKGPRHRAVETGFKPYTVLGAAPRKLLAPFRGTPVQRQAGKVAPVQRAGPTPKPITAAHCCPASAQTQAATNGHAASLSPLAHHRDDGTIASGPSFCSRFVHGRVVLPKLSSDTYTYCYPVHFILCCPARTPPPDPSPSVQKLLYCYLANHHRGFPPSRAAYQTVIRQCGQENRPIHTT